MSMALAEQYVGTEGRPIVVRQALAFFERSVETSAAHVEDFCYLADLYARINRYMDAEKLLERAERDHGQQWLISYYRGIVQNQAGMKEAALRTLTDASRIAPFRSDPDWKMAQIHLALGNTEMAERLTKQSKAKKAKRKAIAEEGLTKV